MKKRILVVDDDPQILELVAFTLENNGHEILRAESGSEALMKTMKEMPDLVLLDLKLPDKNGDQVLAEIKETQNQVPVVMMSAHGTIKVAIEAIKKGALDFIEKPFEIEELELKVQQVFEKVELKKEVKALRNQLGEKYSDKAMIASAPAMKEVMKLIDVAAGSEVNVLIQGESGTGKEMVARAIHFGGDRGDAPFIGINCAAIPSNLLESELFGHEKGAFTGAVARKLGKFEKAGCGTIFLDEIGDLSADLQVKLLRVLQEKEIERLGGHEQIPLQARFVFATNKDLKKLIEAGDFREDLYFRMNVLNLPVPALRERKEDLAALVDYFCKQFAKEESVKIEPTALKKIQDYPWPGNIRELENFIQRTLLLKTESEKVITVTDTRSLEGAVREGSQDESLDAREKIAIGEALDKSNGNIAQASKLLGISRDTFYRKMKRYGIERE